MCIWRAVAGGLSRSSLCQANPNALELLVGAKANSWLVGADENERQIESPVHRDYRCAVSVAIVSAANATTPQYQIYDIGVIDPGDDASQGFGVSHGGIAVGRSIRTGGSQAFSWTLQGGIVGLPNLAGRNHAVANSAAESGCRRDCSHHTFRQRSVADQVVRMESFPSCRCRRARRSATRTR